MNLTGYATNTYRMGKQYARVIAKAKSKAEVRRRLGLTPYDMRQMGWDNQLTGRELGLLLCGSFWYKLEDMDKYEPLVI